MPKANYTLEEKRDFARNMRRNMTRAEQAIWWKLSRNHFGYRFARQITLQGYIVDFYCAQLRLVLEIDGSVHAIEDVGADDEQRERNLEEAGFLVLRFSNEDVLDHMPVVLTRLWDECAARRAALKAFAPGSVLGKGKKQPVTLSSSCGSVQKPSAPATVDKLSVDATPEICANAEDYAAMYAAMRKLVILSRQRSMNFGSQSPIMATVNRRAELQYQISQYLKLKVEALKTTEPETLTVAKGMHVITPSTRRQA